MSRIRPALACAFAGVSLTGAFAASAVAGDLEGSAFRRVSSFPAFLNTSVELETVAEIVTATPSGELLLYTDSKTESLGFVDIVDPTNPRARGAIRVGGEPTSVAYSQGFALVCVNSSESFANPSGLLQVVDVNTREIVASLDLGGQPDAIAANERYAVVAIENERDENLGTGEPPQLPAGFVQIVDLVGTPDEWTTRAVNLVGVADLFPEDPEPEFVDINRINEAVVTLQENNHIAIVDLASGRVVDDFSAGAVDLVGIDTTENDLIEQDSTLKAVPREPDGVTWLDVHTLATADEGDLFGGSRGYTIFDRDGAVLHTSGNELEFATAKLGHYPESRSEDRGNEPEGIEFARFDGNSYLFVGSERSSLVFVYDVNDPRAPQLLQALPAGAGPEGLLAIPRRDLFVVVSEVDDRAGKIRSSISVYARGPEGVSYPTIESVDRSSGAPIPWGALSGLALDPDDDTELFAVYDDAYTGSRILEIDHSSVPAAIVKELELYDGEGVLYTSLYDVKRQLPEAADFDVDALFNDYGSVNLDLEGVAISSPGTIWVVAEGAGNLVGGVSDPNDRPFKSPNILIEAYLNGSIFRAVFLPIDMTRDQLRFGFEGVAVDDTALGFGSELVTIAFQRHWPGLGDPPGFARIGRYDVETHKWAFALYELANAISPNGGWVGLSEIESLGDGVFALIERDNQGGADAAIKWITSIDTNGVEFRPHDDPRGFEIIPKTIVRNTILAGDYASLGLPTLEKLEGLAVTSTGTAFLVNDNDGVDGNSGETRLIRLEGLFDKR